MAQKSNIKFSHAYSKLEAHGKTITAAVLLQVISVTLDQLSKEFIDYDTDNGRYKLVYDTLYLMLIFRKPDGNIFTTLRPQFNQFGNKMPYYQGLVGKELSIIINEPAAAKAMAGEGGAHA